MEEETFAYHTTMTTTKTAFETLIGGTDTGIKVKHYCRRSEIPDQIVNLVNQIDAEPLVSETDFINDYVPEGRRKFKEVNIRQREMKTRIKSQFVKDAIKIVRGEDMSLARGAKLALLNIQYDRDIKIARKVDRFHEWNEKYQNEKAGNIIHSPLQCKRCFQEEVPRLSFSSYIQRTKLVGKATLRILNHFATTFLLGCIMLVILNKLGPTGVGAEEMLFEGFDCRGGIHGIKTLSGNCFDENDFHMENETVALLSTIEEEKFPGFRCSLHRTENYLYCGWDSTESVILPSTTNILQEVSWEVCLTLALEQRINLRGTEKVVSKSGILVDRYHRIGNTQHAGHKTITCEGQTVRLNGEILSQVLVNTQDTYTVTKVQMSLDRHGQIRDLTNRIRIEGDCRLPEHHCKTPSFTYVWKQKFDLTSKCWLRLLKTAEVTRIAKTHELFSEELKLHMIQEDFEQGFPQCGLRLYKTNHKRLYVSDEIEKSKSLKTKEKGSDLALYITSRDEFLRYQLEILKQRTTNTKINTVCAANRIVNHQGLLPARERGTFFKNRGEAATLIKCKRVLLRHFPDGECYGKLPVVYRNRQMFLNPVSRIITETGDWRNCSNIMTQVYLNTKGEWVEIGKNSTRILNLNEKHAIFDDKIYDFDTGLVDTIEIQTLQNDLTHLAFMTESARRITSVICPNNICLEPLPQEDIQKGWQHEWTPMGASQRLYSKIKEEFVGSLEGKLSTIGGYFAIAIAIGVFIKIMARLLSFCYRMYRMDGIRGFTCTNVNNSLQTFDPVKFTELQLKLEKASKEITKIQNCIQLLVKARESGGNDIETAFNSFTISTDQIMQNN